MGRGEWKGRGHGTYLSFPIKSSLLVTNLYGLGLLRGKRTDVTLWYTTSVHVPETKFNSEVVNGRPNLPVY